MIRKWEVKKTKAYSCLNEAPALFLLNYLKVFMKRVSFILAARFSIRFNADLHGTSRLYDSSLGDGAYSGKVKGGERITFLTSI